MCATMYVADAAVIVTSATSATATLSRVRSFRTFSCFASRSYVASSWQSRHTYVMAVPTR